MITSWSTSNADAGSTVRLAVTRFDDYRNGAYVLARSNIEVMPAYGSMATFPAHIPVSGGEQISLEVIANSDQDYPWACYYGTGVEETLVHIAGNQTDEASWTRIFGTADDSAVNLAATLETDPSAAPPRSSSGSRG